MSKGYKILRRYRLTVVNENTLNTLWTLRLTRSRLWLLVGVGVAAVCALIFCIVVWSPVSYLLPGYMQPEQRRTTVDNTLRVDSMLAEAEARGAYVDNIVAILTTDEPDTTALAAMATPAESSDSLMAATEAERAFVADWKEKERTNLSVLTPVLAEGMMFRSPLAGAVAEADGQTLRGGRGATVMAMQDGTVVDSRIDAQTGRYAVIVQHANDFLSIYSGLGQLFVSPGQRVVAGQALGQLGSDGLLTATLYHSGRRTPLP